MIRGAAPVVLTVRTLVAAPPAAVFDLELDMDVHVASLGRSGETATTSSGRSVLQLGDEVTFTARHLGRRWRMTSRVTEHGRPRGFVDEQVRGPFAAMRHEHGFEDDGRGGTVMTDRMTLSAPFGLAGLVVARVVLKPYLTRLLRTRAEHVKRVAEAGRR